MRTIKFKAKGMKKGEVGIFSPAFEPLTTNAHIA